ncbi:flagellar basal body rod C-terminal domain-containing protein [Caulobacter sp. 602-1]|uniref:flagellar basal body rod C-terminal domain-containing protein n=1 Tax=Caulobacter sp. 602-1 TaxID=2492472 RepID=UPI000F63B8AA|nr:flagellar basal body rod C-terminal domain-containing protein [Caulobacter sp. 602-1]RRN66486.1 flagellar hook protein FlgE [Caulobacter sp. 602-1]
MQALSIAASGMMAAADRLNASAQRVAASDAQAAESLGDVDYVKERTEQIGAATDFKANAAVVRVADEMNKRLLDLKV